MTLPSGEISLVDLNNTLNGGAGGPIYLTSFYANGSTKSRGMTGVPLSGAIGLQGFQGKRAIPVVSGLIGKYTGESWNGSTLVDETGSGNNSSALRGTVTTATGQNSLLYIYGETSSGLQFPPAILPSTYTLIHLARYNGATRQRIFDGITNNWLSGFWGWEQPTIGGVGVAFHDGWLMDSSLRQANITGWVLSSDQNYLYRMNGTTIGTAGGGTNTQLSINSGYYTYSPNSLEASDWAVHCFFVYNRTLSLSEIQDMETYMRGQYQTRILSMNDWYSLFTRVNSTFTITQSGSDPNVQLQMNSINTQSSNTSLWYNNAIQNYPEFVIEFEIFIISGSLPADGSSFNIGHTTQSFFGEGPNAPAFCIAFQIYNANITPGIYLYNNTGTQVGFYQITLSNGIWTPVRIIYKRSTTNTWQIFYNNINVINYSNPNNESWVTSSAGANFGFGSRTGGGTHDFYIRRFNLYNQD